MKKRFIFIPLSLLLLCSCSQETSINEGFSVTEQSSISSFDFEPDFAGERGTVDEQFGLSGSVKDGFVYYEGGDGFYEYDPETKEAIKVTGANLGINAVDCGFIHYEPNYDADITGRTGKLQYMNFKGEILYEHYFEAGPEYGLIAYDNRLYYDNYYYDVKTEKKVKLFPDDASDYIYEEEDDEENSVDESERISVGSYVLSNDYYMRIKLVGKQYNIERLKFADNSIDMIALPENIDLCDLAVDRNSDIYVSSVLYLDDGSWSYEIYKVSDDGSTEKIDNCVPNSMHFTVLNGDISYIDTEDILSIYSGGSVTEVADNVFDFAVLNERFVLYKTMVDGDRSDTSVYDGLYLYDREDGICTELKTVTEE